MEDVYLHVPSVTDHDFELCVPSRRTAATTRNSVRQSQYLTKGFSRDNLNSSAGDAHDVWDGPLSFDPTTLPSLMGHVIYGAILGAVAVRILKHRR